MDLKKSIYSKEFKFKDTSGIENTIVLLPLTGKNLPVLFRIARKFGNNPEDQKMLLDALDDSTVNDLVLLCTETLKRSLPDSSSEDIDSFVGVYMLQLFPIIIELNLGNIKQ